eukprot:SAG11_NODE_825_length_6992_cov_2.298564_7_plen_108_part_00
MRLLSVRGCSVVAAPSLKNKKVGKRNETMLQIAFADKVLLNKTDLVSPTGERAARAQPYSPPTHTKAIVHYSTTICVTTCCTRGKAASAAPEALTQRRCSVGSLYSR